VIGGGGGGGNVKIKFAQGKHFLIFVQGKQKIIHPQGQGKLRARQNFLNPNRFSNARLWVVLH